MLTKFSRIVGVTYMYVIICAVCKTMGTYADTVRSCTNLHTCMPVCIHCFSLHPCDVDDFCVKFTERLNIYIYIYIEYIYVYVYICMYVYTHTKICVHTDVDMDVFICIHLRCVFIRD